MIVFAGLISLDCCHQVACVDYGSQVSVTEKDLWVLPSVCASTPGFALRCHLADITPAGDITKWSQTSCETLRSKLMSSAACFIVPKVHYISHCSNVLLTTDEFYSSGCCGLLFQHRLPCVGPCKLYNRSSVVSWLDGIKVPWNHVVYFHVV